MKPADSRPSVPLDLRLVSYLYLVAGAAAAAHMVVAAIAGRPLVNAAVLFLLLGWKLLRLRGGWRRMAVVVSLAIPLVGALFTGYLYLLNLRPIVAWLGFGRGLLVGILATGAALALLAWQIFVLTRPRTRALFGDGPLPAEG